MAEIKWIGWARRTSGAQAWSGDWLKYPGAEGEDKATVWGKLMEVELTASPYDFEFRILPEGTTPSGQGTFYRELK